MSAYEWIHPIAEGGVADVWLARRHMTLDNLPFARNVVIKAMKEPLTQDPRFVELFKEEARLEAQMQHGRIVQVFDYGHHLLEGQRRLCIVMEYVEGYDLARWMRHLSQKQHAVPIGNFLFILTEVLSALAYAHAGIVIEDQPITVVHRDLSPSNVLLSFNGEVKLCDFGIAQALHASQWQPQRFKASQDSAFQTQILGKSAYMSPEQASGEPTSFQSDLFSIAIVLWELCSGRRLYKGSKYDMLELAKKGQVPMLELSLQPLNSRLNEIIDLATRRNPGDRWASASAMRGALIDAIESQGLRSGEPELARHLAS